MPLVAVFAVAISFLTKYLITKALLALGLGYVTYVGINALHDWFAIRLILAYNDMPTGIYAIATLAGLDVAINILLAAVATAWSIKTVGAAATTLLKFTGVDSPTG